MAEPQEQDRSKEEQGKTPGQLLAAKKAAKAAKKAAKRGRQAEVRETEAIRATSVAADWLRRNRRTLWIALAAGVVVVGGVSAWAIWDAERDHEASGLLWDGTQAATGSLEGGFDPAGETGETFTSVEARAEAASERFGQVIEQYPGSEPARWARLGRATALVEQGETEQAREILRDVLPDVDTDALFVRWRVLEGIAQAYEADEKWADATKQYKAIRDLDDPRIQMQARYHLARLQHVQGHDEQAIEALKDLRGELRGEEAPDLPHLSQRTEELLGFLDPDSATPGGAGIGRGRPPRAGAAAAGPGAGGSPKLSPEQLQKLMKQLKKSGAAGAKGGGGQPAGAGAKGGGSPKLSPEQLQKLMKQLKKSGAAGAKGGAAGGGGSPE